MADKEAGTRRLHNSGGPVLSTSLGAPKNPSLPRCPLPPPREVKNLISNLILEIDFTLLEFYVELLFVKEKCFLMTNAPSKFELNL